MEIFILIMRLVLAGVLAVAGIAKLADLAGSRQAMRDFGLPTSLAAPLGVLLPLAEIAIALALLGATTAWAGAIAALLLLLLFVAGISFNLVRGRTPNCHCFGQLQSEPIGRATVVRNVLLMIPAALIITRGPTAVGISLFGWLTDLSPLGYAVLIASLLAVAVIALQTWVVFNLLRQNGRLLLRLESIESHLGLQDPTTEVAAAQPTEVKGLPVGTPAPTFELPALNGTHQSFNGLLTPNKSLLLIFSSPTCGPCVDLMPEVVQWQRAHDDKLTIAMITRGNLDDVRAKMGELDAARILLQKETEVATAYQITGTPSAVLIGADGNIRSPIAGGPTAIRELVTHATQPLNVLAERLLRRAPIQLDAGDRAPAANGQPQPATLTLGDAAPMFQLPDLDGKEVDLGKLRGASTLLLFWNPSCGYCRRMVSDLQAWEADRPANAPRLVLISTGTEEANRAYNLRSPILLDSGFRTGFAYGAKGTPSALLVDAQGKVASEVVVGAPSIMPLLNTTPTLAAPLVAQPMAT